MKCSKADIASSISGMRGDFVRLSQDFSLCKDRFTPFFLSEHSLLSVRSTRVGRGDISLSKSQVEGVLFANSTRFGWVFDCTSRSAILSTLEQRAENDDIRSLNNGEGQKSSNLRTVPVQSSTKLHSGH
ncbi:hypothetical protein AcW2_007327 [Taiwanofungus camphoratus]|nr:hypothetical protein AcW2_007327 [Antrodia cinnamomea]